MDLNVFKHDGEYYTCGPGSAVTLRWRQDEGHWVAIRDEVPGLAEKLTVQDLPVELQEEMLAYAARSATMGVQYRNPMN